MSRPTTQLLWMVVGLVAAGGVVFLLWDRIVASFLHNPVFNAGILVALLAGIIFVFYQVARLTTDINWIENFQRGGNPGSFTQPRLLAPLAAMVKDKPHHRLRSTPRRCVRCWTASRRGSTSIARSRATSSPC